MRDDLQDKAIHGQHKVSKARRTHKPCCSSAVEYVIDALKSWQLCTAGHRIDLRVMQPSSTVSLCVANRLCVRLFVLCCVRQCCYEQCWVVVYSGTCTSGVFFRIQLLFDNHWLLTRCFMKSYHSNASYVNLHLRFVDFKQFIAGFIVYTTSSYCRLAASGALV